MDIKEIIIVVCAIISVVVAISTLLHSLMKSSKESKTSLLTRLQTVKNLEGYADPKVLRDEKKLTYNQYFQQRFKTGALGKKINLQLLDMVYMFQLTDKIIRPINRCFDNSKNVLYISFFTKRNIRVSIFQSFGTIIFAYMMIFFETKELMNARYKSIYSLVEFFTLPNSILFMISYLISLTFITFLYIKIINYLTFKFKLYRAKKKLG